MQEDLPIPDDPRIDRDPSEPIQPPGQDEPEDPYREQPIDEPDDAPSHGEPERRDPGGDPPLQLENPEEVEQW
ncbi:MAG TPA: hypothetical protein VNM67_21060 [Thermoanaerobaculia bacterium]|jgi:hypothetical protein|nr:hypothetical protein [Thermoanaerobaculia bacterium]